MCTSMCCLVSDVSLRDWERMVDRQCDCIQSMTACSLGLMVEDRLLVLTQTRECEEAVTK